MGKELGPAEFTSVGFRLYWAWVSNSTRALGGIAATEAFEKL